ncbi:lycopene cyclase [Aggregatimonas sangjinii]|uniref:Lycopene cyclase n=1 Tax=Aggregatimonas sangjinii TaxID=2583587 RepID=A0A5B7SSM1_9FLAO|nr:lycopene cyclase family protein [Aggregatimonas sangjinii]QCX01676.1 lycopene cyclase [Aggregatimonas sangjinii]
MEYDYIILGAGAAGLMLADAMCSDDFFKGKSILLLDKERKQNNDRTWCYWEEDEGLFDDIVFQKWNYIYFAGKELRKQYNIAPYSYKMIRGIDFYEAILKRIEDHPGITFQLGEVTSVEDDGKQVVVTTATHTFFAKKVFNSIFDYKMAVGQTKYPVLQQHFIGWFIKADKPIFKKDQATFMDFSIPQNGNTRFMYVLPFSEYEGLVEYTLFSEKLLPEEEYESAIQAYLQNDLGCEKYKIIEKEQGSIPMTCYDFKEHHSANVRYIGTAGGWSKASTGYTFMSTAKKIPIVIKHIKSGKPLHRLNFKNKFWYYDLLLLDILHRNNELGGVIFETLFKNRKPQLIFKFLDEDTNLWEDLKYILGCPKWIFLKAFLRRLL